MNTIRLLNQANKLSLPLLGILLITACGSLPRTKQEFRTYSKQHEGVSTLTVNAPLNVVVSRLKNHIEKCNSVHKTTKRTEGGMPVSRIDEMQFGEWEKTKNNTHIVSTRIISPQTINQPKEGQIFHIMELSSKGSGTYVVMYDMNAPWGVYDFTTEYKSAVLGEKGICQHEE